MYSELVIRPNIISLKIKENHSKTHKDGGMQTVTTGVIDENIWCFQGHGVLSVVIFRYHQSLSVCAKFTHEPVTSEGRLFSS